jgi:hypothetical protein
MLARQTALRLHLKRRKIHGSVHGRAKHEGSGQAEPTARRYATRLFI